MTLTFIDTNTLPKSASAGQGESVEVLNEHLCKARNVQGSLRWLKSTDVLQAAAGNRHQLVYLLEGKGSIRLNDKDYVVEKGAGIYLGPAETATVRAAGGAPLKLLHLIVPHIPA